MRSKTSGYLRKRYIAFLKSDLNMNLKIQDLKRYFLWWNPKTRQSVQPMSNGEKKKILKKKCHSWWLKPVHIKMLRQRNLKKQLYFYVRPTVHTNPSQKRSFWKTLFKPDEFENADLNCGRKTFWKRSFFKPISRKQSRGLPARVLLNFKFIHSDRLLLCFQISLA